MMHAAHALAQPLTAWAALLALGLIVATVSIVVGISGLVVWFITRPR